MKSACGSRRNWRAVGLLAGGIAHDFNNLLTGSCWLCQPGDGRNSSGAGRENPRSDRGRREGGSSYAPVARVRTGKGQFKVQDVDVSRAVQEIADLVQFSIPKSVQLSVNVEKRLPLVRMDPGQLQQILMNLVINAGEAVGEGVRAESPWALRCETLKSSLPMREANRWPAGRYVCIEISDTGEGISEEGKGDLEPFYTTKFTGRGLGLAARRRNICGLKRRDHTIESVRGAGSSFRVFLPVAREFRECDNPVQGDGRTRNCSRRR